MNGSGFAISSRRNRGLRHPASYCFVGVCFTGRRRSDRRDHRTP